VGDTDKPATTADVVPAVHWESLAGVAATRPYVKGCLSPGTGARRLDFGQPRSGTWAAYPGSGIQRAATGIAGFVRSERTAPNGESWALNTLIRYVFRDAIYGWKDVPVTWFDGDACLRRVQALWAS